MRQEGGGWGWGGGRELQHMHVCERKSRHAMMTYSLRNSVRVRCWMGVLLSSSADWARLRKPRILRGYTTHLRPASSDLPPELTSPLIYFTISLYIYTYICLIFRREMECLFISIN